MNRHKVTAFDVDHNMLWITIGSSHVGAEARISTDRASGVVNTYRRTTGQIIDPETGRPVVRVRDPRTGRRIQGSRRIAYFRTYTNGHIAEIYITEHGRRAGIRNHETRRDSDTRSAHILGHPPIHTGPRVVDTGHSYELVIGEGNPYGFRTMHQPNIDRWGDPVVHIATCHRVTLADSDGSWWGYTYYNYCTMDHCPLANATVADVRRHLMGEAQVLIEKHGSDITRW